MHLQSDKPPKDDPQGGDPDETPETPPNEPPPVPVDDPPPTDPAGPYVV